jgi:3'-phosphoadenosine 5'-phosphosulfate sulfotransferase (PAPS reductase)/FAD synthetase
MKIESYTLVQRQSLPLELKVKMSLKRIKEYYEHFDGKVYVSFSGGKDSVVLLDLVRTLYPEIEAVCVPMEFPENLAIVKKTKNSRILKLNKTFFEVKEKYGLPIISKSVSKNISRFRNTKSQMMKQKYLGMWNKQEKLQAIPKKWQFLVNADFKISNECCNHCKKIPLQKYEKESGKKPIIGVIAEESQDRRINYLRFGCNVFEGKSIRSNPIAFWTEKDIWDYIKKNKLKYSKIYDMGYDRSGCPLCLYGIQHETGLNRIQKMQIIHPALYKIAIEKLHYDKILTLLKIPYKNEDRQMKLNECVKNGTVKKINRHT